MKKHRNWLKISHHRHTGRLRPHEYTSYFPLLVLLLIVGAILGFDSVFAQTSLGGVDGIPSPGPLGASISLSGTMPGTPPKTPAVITAPSGGSFTDSPITVQGTCTSNLVVEIYDNDIFAGSTVCNNNQFSLKVGLLIGPNQLIARVYNANNQAGPDSNQVNVSYGVLPVQGAPISLLNLSSSQLILNTSAVFRGIFPGQPLNVPISIIGGTPPYALNVQWGDLANLVVSRNNNTTFTLDHTYNRPGVYQISLQATDSIGRIAFLTVAVIVNGQPVLASTTGNGSPPNSRVLALWPLWTASVATVISFWLGERREKHVLTIHPSLRVHA